ncbi:MAG: bifunctional 5,10-methylenetetrahydrofolate dehydrogenase/5,10-methenyltetrahydrofolate cyclohydrolase [Nitrososphaeraceae archaeon]
MIINGLEVASKIKKELKNKIIDLNAKGIVPCLATILVGEDPASSTYVKNKHKACLELGILTKDKRMPSTTTQKELIELIKMLNIDKSIHGILLQLPIPKHIDEFEVVNTIDPKKDVDGLTNFSSGLLFNNRANLIPCTPHGIIKLFEYYNIELDGKDIVIINRSNLVGKPLSILLLQRNATVTICHSHTKNLDEKLRKADIIITAVGNRKKFTLKNEDVKDNVIIVDVGISRENGKVIGDVEFDSIANKAAWITPVPGGVGPMTITMLLQNTITASSFTN